ncbi:bifunctional riboflavin kinase/FMN adenylyltransferase [Bifidobacterium sp. ESL0728]|uniref:riboflavin kinase n=1 Tax=Bifidobacterium sp. ESL0728 TaxID=2983220 RepID=UPI0023F75DB5|nr:riboflavin kinase [Bifidobacterium sp. ESL0728]WEV59456.1 bifunctional riboflavin kinase/FMN adenylyltransferase [Bifidobacterium sp. ESL0728]
MKITRLTPDSNGLVDWPILSSHKRAVMTIGVFDGMHKGHQAVVRRVVELAKQTGSLAVVMILDPRPALAHTYANEHDGMDLPADYVDTQALSSVEQRARIMRELGVDRVIVLHYTMAFAAKSFRFFLGQMVGKLGMRTLVLGQDAALGANRKGDIKAIQELCEATRVFELDVVNDLGPGYTWVPSHFEPKMPEGIGEPQDPREAMNKAELRAWTKKNNCRKVRVWSSSNVRYLLSQGCVKAVAEILGRDHAVEGAVVHGEQRGREIGFPTANLSQVVEGYVPVDGVYAGWLVDLGPIDGAKSSGNNIGDAGHGKTGNGVNGTENSGSAANGGNAGNAGNGTNNMVNGGSAGGGNGGKPAGENRTANGVEAANLASPSDEMRMAPGSPWRWPAAISIGTKPTYSDETGLNERVIEPYCVTKDWLELYDHKVRVEFTQFLRGQVKFDGTDELKAALQDYAEQTLEITGAQ